MEIFVAILFEKSEEKNRGQSTISIKIKVSVSNPTLTT